MHALPKNLKIIGMVVAVIWLGVAVTPLWAFWLPRDTDELVRDADVIVVLKYEGFAVSERIRGLDIQKGRFQRMKVLKGNIEQAVFVRGDNSGMCAPIINFEGFEKGVYLAFLKSGDNGWYPLDAKMIPLQGDKLMWPETGGGGNVSRQSLNEVQRSINKMLTAKISL